jgi:phosphoribosylglycinamide formyltransferase-1
VNIALFASGEGTNALQLLKAASTMNRIRIPLVIVDQPSSTLPHKVKDLFPQVEVALVTRAGSREDHEKEILSHLRRHSVEWCFLAGFMRVLGPVLLQGLKGKSGRTQIINIHPSLLPKYPGLESYRKAFEANESEGGATVHWVDEGVDTGPIIIQKKFPRLATDTLHDFIERGKQLEWKIYPEVLKALNDRGDLDGVNL